jgi:hypothetical protein
MKWWQLLLVCIFGLRMLVPPGVCLCHLADTRAEMPAHEEDDHTPSCPAAPNGNIWIKGHPTPPLPLDLALATPCLPDEAIALAIADTSAVGFPLPFDAHPRHLALTVLLI